MADNKVTEIYDGEFYINDNGELVCIELEEDAYRLDPRDDEFNMGTFYTWMHWYCSPDSGRPNDAQELGEEFDLEIDDSLYDFIKEFNKRRIGVAMPVYAIDHSGVEYRAAHSNPFFCPWDSGLAGVIFATNERIKEMYCIDEVTAEVVERVENEFIAEVKTYNDWANGNVYGFITYDKNGNEVDSCWGFIGNDAENIASNCGGLHECEFHSLDEYLDAHREDPDVLVYKYNRTRTNRDRLNESMRKQLQEIVNKRHIDVKFEGDQLVLA